MTNQPTETSTASEIQESCLRPGTRVRAVVFDLDGLMLNTEMLYPRVMEELLSRRGLPYTYELIDQMMGRPGSIALQIMIEHHKLADTVDGLWAESDLIFDAIWQVELALMPGLAELLLALEQHNIPKAIATSSRLHTVQRMLERFALAPRFQFILTAEDVTHGKPDPEIYLTAAKRMGVSPKEMMVLEDSQNGCRAAIAAGAIAVAVPGEHNRTRHSFDGCELIADSLADARIFGLLGVSGSQQWP